MALGLILMILARLLSCAPDTDGEHWNLQLRHHVDAWHTDAFRLPPAPTTKSASGDRIGPPYPWRPNAASFSAADTLFPDALSFQIAANTANQPPTLDIQGYVPANTQAPASRPQVPLQATTATTGGSIAPGSYSFALSAGANGPVSILVKVVIPAGGSTNTITISGIVWSAAATISVYAGPDSQHMVAINGSYWSGSGSDGFGNPTSIKITQLVAASIFIPAPLQPIALDGPGLPDPNFSSIMLRAKTIVHGGVWGYAVSSIGTSGPIHTPNTVLFFNGAAWSTNQWQGYVIADYSIPPSGSGAIVRNWVVTSSDATSLTIAYGYPNYPNVVDAVVMRAAAGSISANTIGDANFVSTFSPAGLTVNAEAGNLVMIIAGTGKGQPPIPIKSNTSTVVTLARNWYATPDSTSVWIVISPSWTFMQLSSPFHNDGTLGQIPIGSIPIPNFQGGSLLVEGVALDSDGNPSIERYAPFREIFVPPVIVPGNYTSDGYFVNPIVGGAVTIDLAKGLSQEIVLPTPATAVTINGATFTGGVIGNGTTFRLRIVTPASGAFEGPTFSTGAGTFAGSTQSQYTTSPLNNVADVMEFEYRGSVFGLTQPPMQAVSLT